MVTANSNHERRPSSVVDSEEDENNTRQIQTRLDRLYMESSQYQRSSTQQQPYPQRTLSPSNSRDMYMTTNTVPVYRHGRKFYVSMEEFERMRVEERRHRRTVMQKSQNLPVSKSQSINLRTSSYNPIQRSTSNPHEHRYGVLRAPHLPVNSVLNNNHFNRNESTRQSRPTFRYSDDRDDLSSMTSAALPMRLPTTAIRSNSSDKVLDLQKPPQPSMSSYSGYTSDNYELKRSTSAEIAQPTQVPPQAPPRRTVPPTSSDYGMSTVSAFPVTSTDQTYNQSNASKLTSYFHRIPPATLNPPMKSSASTYTGTGTTYETGMQETDHSYSVLGSSSRRSTNGLTSVLARPPMNNSNNEYYIRDTNSGSYSDDNSSSPSMFIPRRNTDNHRYRRAQLVVETDDDYRRGNDIVTRSTARSQSSDGLTEKKRVRFADMEGFTLETVPDIEQQRRSPMMNRLLTKRSYGQSSTHFQGQIQPFQNSFYQPTTRVGGGESKLATDV